MTTIQQGVFDDRVAQTWVEHFGRSGDNLDLAGTVFIPRPRLEGSGAVHIAFIRARAFVEVDPRLSAEFEALVTNLHTAVALTADMIMALLPSGRVAAVYRGLVFHLEPEQLIVHQPAPPITLRALSAADAAAMADLFVRCDPADVDEAYVAVDHELAYGCFQGERMVAAGSGYRRNGFMDIGVLTDPVYRGRRLAPSLVAAISQMCHQQGVIGQYRCDSANVASKRVAEASGYTLHFKTEAVDLVAG